MTHVSHGSSLCESCQDSAVNNTLNSFQLHDTDIFSTALAGKELGKDVGQWGPSTVAGAIKCVDVTIVAECMLMSLFSQIVGAKLPRCIANKACRRPDLPDGRKFGIISSHPKTSSLQAIEMGRSRCHRVHRYSAWNRRSQPDLL